MSDTLSSASSDNELLQNIELGSKIVLLMRILKESERVGDKVLVFSQSLLSLDLIETFLEVILGVACCFFKLSTPYKAGFFWTSA